MTGTTTLQAFCTAVVLTGIIPAGSAVAGCTENARLADQELRHAEVHTVHDQGLELGPDASPQDVVFVLLRAIRDDVRAASDREAGREALARQLAVCDADFIYDDYRRVFGQRAVADRDEWVHQQVRLWAPTLAHYVAGLDFDRPTAETLLRVGKPGQHYKWPGQTVAVELPLADPQGHPRRGVVARIWLHQHDLGYWRVFHVGFSRSRPQPSGPPAPGAAATANPSPGAERQPAVGNGTAQPPSP